MGPNEMAAISANGGAGRYWRHAQTGRRLVLCRNGRILIHRGRWRIDREITLEIIERAPRWQPDTRPVISGAVARTTREALRRNDRRKDH